MNEEPLPDRIRILLGDLEWLLQHLVGGYPAIHEPLDITDRVLDDLALLL